MKKFTLLTMSFLLLLFVTPVVTQAAYDPYEEACNSGSGKKFDPADHATACQEDGSNPLFGTDGVINKVATGIVMVGSAVAVIFMMMGGYKMILSNGDSKKFADGRSTMIYAAVGLVIFVLAKALVSFIMARIS